MKSVKRLAFVSAAIVGLVGLTPAATNFDDTQEIEIRGDTISVTVVVHDVLAATPVSTVGGFGTDYSVDIRTNSSTGHIGLALLVDTVNAGDIVQGLVTTAIPL